MTFWSITFTAMLALMLVPAVAQSPDSTGSLRDENGGETTRELKSDSQVPDRPATEKSDRSPEQSQRLLVTRLLGQQLHGRDGTVVGRVTDLVLSNRLDGLVAIVEVGGVLGLGGRVVAVPAEDIVVSRDSGGNLTLSAAITEEQLLAAPVFDRTALMR